MNIRLMGRMCLRCRERDHLCKTFLTRVENERERGEKKEEEKKQMVGARVKSGIKIVW